MLFLWVAATVGGLLTAILASRTVVEHAAALARHSRLPPFIVGLTLLAIGTDLPEIANSIVASAGGNGDVNVGDSVGSAVVQVTLVLGLLPFFGEPHLESRRSVVIAGVLTATALALGAGLLADGFLGRPDAIILVSAWIAATWVVGAAEPELLHQPKLELDTNNDLSNSRRVMRILVGLAFVAGGASLAVWGIIAIADSVGIPAYIIAFFGASIGTSLPELVVVVTAIRRGQTAIAIGDIFGASLIDSTLSIGIGPLFFPTAVTSSLTVPGSLVASVAVIVVTLLFSRITNHDRRSGLLLLIIYGTVFAVLL